eukprot:CAMPEP_0183733364 /NCGR_PEP_ID=MMETSP0737-20130205/40966_1 /TAXON_ID=385413 /ORGANISM="Thalassiosira miniscula, Strain CCMP1093" /LENGTH=107 /DNA_ID=CAMNT_0025966603 /DNA_START=432 /DNA_END=752 /DNA_ORIENTATION=-
MTQIDKLLLWICNSAFLFAAVNGNNLRGTRTAVIRDNDNDASFINEPHNPISSPALGDFDGPYSNMNITRNRQLKIFGKDNRRSFRDSSWPWSAVGRVQTASGSCTG